MLGSELSQQFDELGLSIAELVTSDLECKKVYWKAINYNINEMKISDCIVYATNEVKKFVVERNRLESEAYLYFLGV